MAFSKKKVDDRKQWLQGFVPGTFLDHAAETISYSHFVHKVGGSWWGAQWLLCRLWAIGCVMWPRVADEAPG